MRNLIKATVFATALFSIPSISHSACKTVATGLCEGIPIKVRMGVSPWEHCMFFSMHGDTAKTTYYLNRNHANFLSTSPMLVAAALSNSTIQFVYTSTDPSGNKCTTVPATFTSAISVGITQ